MTDVRVGAHGQEGYDRLVVELSGGGTPGWLAPRWAREATTPGKGEPIEVGGSHLLIITGTGTGTQDYRVLALQGPTRLVIDVAYPGRVG